MVEKVQTTIVQALARSIGGMILFVCRSRGKTNCMKMAELSSTVSVRSGITMQSFTVKSTTHVVATVDEKQLY